MGVFTTQTLLSSVGISKNRATHGAVAINWILKVMDDAFFTLWHFINGCFSNFQLADLYKIF